MRNQSMADPGHRRSHHRRKNPGFRRAWCCSFGVGPQSPENRSSSTPHTTKPQKPYAGSSFYSSPSPSSKIGLGIIDPRRILSPGRVSPIDSDVPLVPLPQIVDADSVAAAATAVESESESADPPPREKAAVPSRSSCSGGVFARETSLDLRLSLRGKDGRYLVLELDSEVLCESSQFFAGMVSESCSKVPDSLTNCRKIIEVAEVEDLGVFREALELMYEKDMMRWHLNAGVSRTIDMLEVSCTIMFDRGVVSCLKYLEAVPWSESEEEKLKGLFARHTFEESIARDVLDRLYAQAPNNSQQHLALQLIHSVANGSNSSARKDLQSLVNGLLSQSSVYQKDPTGLTKEGLYSICHSCLLALVDLFEEASDSAPTKERKPLIGRISKQVDNLNWLLEILIDRNMAEDFVALWANQNDLISMHEKASPMVRYELSRISASVFIALGRGKLQCPGGVRFGVLRAWFGPMLSDFGWLQRCSKGLDLRMLEEGMGQALLTLPLKQQQSLFVEWFKCFAGRGTECPNLSRAFQVWWRRSFVRSIDALS